MSLALSPFTPENLVSRGGFDVQSHVSPIIRHTQAEFRRTHGIFPALYDSVAIILSTAIGPVLSFSGYAIVYDGVHCEEPASIGPVVLKVVPVAGAACSCVTLDQRLFGSLFPHPILVLSRHVRYT